MPRDEPGARLDATQQGDPSAAASWAGPQALAAAALALAVALGALLLPPPTLTIPGFALLTLALFVPVLCVASIAVKRRHVRLRARVARTQFRHMRYCKAYEDEHPAGDQGPTDIIAQTWLPVLVITLLNIYFARLLVYTPRDLSAGLYGNYLLLAQHLGGGGELDAVVFQSFCAMSFAYLGWHVWTVATIFSRLVTMELVAATYYDVLTRLVVAVFVALVFTHGRALLLADPSTASAELIGFGVGLFPDAALAWMQSTLRRILLHADERLETFPLDMIQGISPFRRLRLSELGLDDCANLASANAAVLYMQSNLKLAEVLDWIGQAQLLVLVGSEKFIRLQANGYRTAIDLQRASFSDARDVVGGLLGYKPEQLADLAAGMRADPSFVKLRELHDELLREAQPRAGRAAEPRGDG